jgi:hypothetical protein
MPPFLWFFSILPQLQGCEHEKLAADARRQKEMDEKTA